MSACLHRNPELDAPEVSHSTWSELKDHSRACACASEAAAELWAWAIFGEATSDAPVIPATVESYARLASQVRLLLGRCLALSEASVRLAIVEEDNRRLMADVKAYERQLEKLRGEVDRLMVAPWEKDREEGNGREASI